MTKKSHQIIGIITALGLNLPVIPALIGSTLPDIDIHFRNKRGGLLFSHRGITHHILLVLVLIASVFLVDNIFYTSFVAGYVSHIVADIMTISGVPYWKNKDRFALKLFKTNSIGEYVFVFILIFIVFGYMIKEKGLYSIVPLELQLLQALF